MTQCFFCRKSTYFEKRKRYLKYTRARAKQTIMINKYQMKQIAESTEVGFEKALT